MLYSELKNGSGLRATPFLYTKKGGKEAPGGALLDLPQVF